MSLLDRFNEEEEDSRLFIDEHSEYYLLQTAKWGKFLAIVGMVMFALFLFAMLFTLLVGGTAASYNPNVSDYASSMFSGVYIIIMMLMIILYVYPIYALYKFSTTIKHAIEHKAQDLFNEALRHLKGLFKFLGLVTIVFIAFYVLMFLFGAMVGVGSTM